MGTEVEDASEMPSVKFTRVSVSPVENAPHALLCRHCISTDALIFKFIITQLENEEKRLSVLSEPIHNLCGFEFQIVSQQVFFPFENVSCEFAWTVIFL